MAAQAVEAIPQKVQTIHLIAVCGTGMGALACMLKEMGYRVSGSDQHVYPPMSDFLRDKGISLFEGYQARHLDSRPDLVVVGNAVSKDNPEVLAVQRLGLAYCSMPQAVNRFAAAGKQQIVVTGTHGKTTTSAFIAWMLYSAGLDPSFLVGGIVTNFQSNFRLGQGNAIVLEGDEYDTAYFDKGPKFWHYTPAVAVLTSVEFDHADIFKDMDHVKQVFGRLLEKLSANATLVAFDQDPNVTELLCQARCAILTYGYQACSAWHLGDIRIDAPFTYFEVWRGNTLWAQFKTRMIGRHNLSNLLAGIAVGHHLNVDRHAMAHAIEHFRGARRRQEVRGVRNDIVVIDDFAHHPTAVKATIEGVKSYYGQRRLIAVFEPRTNSSRRNIFQARYAESFDAADMICIRQPPLLEKIPVAQRFSSPQLVRDLQGRGKQARYFSDTDVIIDHLVDIARPQDVVLIMSNGGFDNIHSRLLDQL
jgi:UDP-N-acetylmuramate: L-alanyl-gamma-D-glutamyl-meso-diaminopimelate ligase